MKGNLDEPKQRSRALPPWMNDPDAPPRPDFSLFKTQISKLNSEKNQLLQEIKQLQNSVRPDDKDQSVKAEREKIKARLIELDAERKKERNTRIKTNEEISALTKQRRENADKIRKLQADLGGFSSAKEIDEAIQYMKRKAKWYGGGVEAEKKNKKRMHQLEEAKTLLLQLQPLLDDVENAEKRERKLEQEYREIFERIGSLNKEYDETRETKRILDATMKESASGRTDAYKQCDVLRSRLNEVFEQIRQLKEEQQNTVKIWDDWCIIAKADYNAKLQAQEEAKAQEGAEEKEHQKQEAKRSRALQRQNPHAEQIHACEVLLKYLHEKEQKYLRDLEQEKKKIAILSFNPYEAVPEGCSIVNEGTAASASTKKVQAPRKFVIRHTADKMLLFKSIDVAAISDPNNFSSCIDEIRSKKQEFESHIKESPVFSDDEGNEAATNDQNGPEQLQSCENEVKED